MRRIKTAVLISGNGSNLQALIDATEHTDYPAQIVLVISNQEEAYGLVRAENAGITTAIIPHTNFATREAFDAMIDATLHTHGIELVCLAGFMRILSNNFVTQWSGKLINIHPSLLPAYKGTRTHQRVLAAGEKYHGCTVHWVTPELDAGEIIAQSSLEILPTDTAETLQARVHTLEHALYPLALKQVAAQLAQRA